MMVETRGDNERGDNGDNGDDDDEVFASSVCNNYRSWNRKIRAIR